MSDGIIKTSELPKIIPPLPTGDTKDLKVWQDYWKQHDKQIRQDEREKVLDMIGKGIMKLSGIVPNIPQDPNDDRIPEIGIDELGYLIKSLRTKPEGT